MVKRQGRILGIPEFLWSQFSTFLEKKRMKIYFVSFALGLACDTRGFGSKVFDQMQVEW